MELTRRLQNVKWIRGNLQCILRVICLSCSQPPTWWHQDGDHLWLSLGCCNSLPHPSRVNLIAHNVHGWLLWLLALDPFSPNPLCFPASHVWFYLYIYLFYNWWSISDIISTGNISPCWHPCFTHFSIRRLLSGVHYGHNCAYPLCVEILSNSSQSWFNFSTYSSLF